MNLHHIVLHLSLIDHVGPGAVQELLSACGTELVHLYSMSVAQLCQKGLSPVLAAKVRDGLQDKSVLDAELALIRKHNVNWISILDDAYPELLKHIHLPPPILYWQGDFSLKQPFAVVGSRATNNYGEQMINQIIPALVANEFTIISGGALGADAMAHRATVQAGGKTIVVLGSGLLHLQPRSNIRLFERVLYEGGALLSSFPLQTKAFAGNFPARNRIISGLSRGVLVVQAAQKSGARITAQYALEQGRDVFAIPGSVHDPLSAGCHALIQEGAKLVMSAQDILVEYGLPQQQDTQQTIAQCAHKQPKQIAISFDNPIQEKIVGACRLAQSIDDLARTFDLELSHIQQELFALQMRGVIEQDFTGMWKAVHS